MINFAPLRCVNIKNKLSVGNYSLAKFSVVRPNNRTYSHKLLILTGGAGKATYDD